MVEQLDGRELCCSRKRAGFSRKSGILALPEVNNVGKAQRVGQASRDQLDSHRACGQPLDLH